MSVRRARPEVTGTCHFQMSLLTDFERSSEIACSASEWAFLVRDGFSIDPFALIRRCTTCGDNPVTHQRAEAILNRKPLCTPSYLTVSFEASKTHSCRSA